MYNKPYNEKNSPDHIKLRRYSDRLAMSGWGVMVLGLWEAIRALMGVYLNRKLLFDFLYENITEVASEARELTIVFVIIILYIVYCFALLMHLYIGVSAMAEGRDKKRRNLYLFFAAAIVFLSLLSFKTFLSGKEVQRSQMEMDVDTVFATALLDTAMCLTCIEMLYCAIRSRLLQRKINNAAKEVR